MRAMFRLLAVFIVTVMLGGVLMLGCETTTSGNGDRGFCETCNNTSECESGYTCLNYNKTYRCGRLGLNC